jgi:transcriptional regulator with GAF, ATPase, and Fis domain
MDGAERTIESRIAFIYKDGRHNVMLSTIRDIIDTKQTQKALLKAHAELTTLLEVSQEIVSTLELEPLLNLVLERLEAVIPYDAAVIGTLGDDHLKLQAYRGSKVFFRTPLLWFDAAKIPSLTRIAQTLEVLYVPNTNDNRDLARALSDALALPLEAVFQYHTWLAVPLISQGCMVGMLIIRTGKPILIISRPTAWPALLPTRLLSLFRTPGSTVRRQRQQPWPSGPGWPETCMIQ